MFPVDIDKHKGTKFKRIIIIIIQGLLFHEELLSYFLS